MDNADNFLFYLYTQLDTIYQAILNLEMNYQTVDICHGIHLDIIDLCPLPKNKDIAPILTSMIKNKYNLSYRQPVGF